MGGLRAVRCPAVGTINMLVMVPERLSDAALVNAVATATEAKAQALAERGGARHGHRHRRHLHRLSGRGTG